MFKVYKGVAPSFMSDVFGMKQNVNTENILANTRSDKTFCCSLNPKTVNNGVGTLRFLAPKMWDMIPSDMKNSSSLPPFKDNIKKWIPHNCPCRLCKLFVPQRGGGGEGEGEGGLLSTYILNMFLFRIAEITNSYNL